MRALRISLLALLAFVLIGALALAWALGRRPSLEPFEDLVLAGEARDAPVAPGSLRLTFLGVTTLLVSDGETSLMTDGFFSRPGLLRTTLSRVAPDPERIEQALARAGVHELAAVIPVHSHYDHAMDAPEVARRTGALLLGSESTANVGRGAGLPEERIRVAGSGETHRFGAFEVTLIRSRHVNFGWNESTLGGRIREPLVPPARATDYEEGVSWSVHVAHPAADLLVQGSAGFVAGALRGRSADVVLLGIGGLGSLDAAYRDAYLAETVEATGASLVIPVHYDDFTQPLDAPLPLMPSAFDDFPGVMQHLREWTDDRPGVRLALLRAFEPVQITADGSAAAGTPARPPEAVRARTRGTAGEGLNRTLEGESELTPEGLASLEAVWRITPLQDFEITTTYHPSVEEWGEDRVVTSADWNVALGALDGLGLRTGVLQEYDTLIDEGDESDLRYYGNLTYDF